MKEVEAARNSRGPEKYIDEKDRERYYECISQAKERFKMPVAPAMPCLSKTINKSRW